MRDALTAAGFVVDKRPGFGRKRDMLAGRYAPRWTTRYPRAVSAPQWPERRAIVVGASLAGSAVAERLSTRGWRIDLLDGAAKGKSSAAILHAGISQPHISRDDCLLSRFTRTGFFYQLAQETSYPHDASVGERSGALQLAADDESEAAMPATVNAQGLTSDYARHVTRDEASTVAGRLVAAGGWWFPTAGWIRAGALVDARLRRPPRNIGGTAARARPTGSSGRYKR